MRLVCVSDTHNHAAKAVLPDGDVLVHAGDFTLDGTRQEFENFAAWLANVPHKYVVVIPGNHDFLAEDAPELANEIISSARQVIHYLLDQQVVLDDIVFYGSPWTPWFGGYAFNLKRGPHLSAVWNRIPANTNVLITHGPPAMIGDMVHHEGRLSIENVGDSDLSGAISKLTHLKAHIYGHIHEGYGLRRVGGVSYANASLLDEHYVSRNKPIVIDI